MMHLWPDPFEWTILILFTTCCPVEMKERKSSGMRKITSDFLTPSVRGVWDWIYVGSRRGQAGAEIFKVKWTVRDRSKR